jgi:hypothetical protein
MMFYSIHNFSALFHAESVHGILLSEVSPFQEPPQLSPRFAPQVFYRDIQ